MCFSASILFSFSQPPRVPYLLSPQTLVSLFPFLNSQTFLSCHLLPIFFTPQFASSDFPHSQLLRQNRNKWFPPSLPPLFLFSAPPPFPPRSPLGLLSAAGLITGCHKCSVFSQKVLAAPGGPRSCWWAAGGQENDNCICRRMEKHTCQEGGR